MTDKTTELIEEARKRAQEYEGLTRNNWNRMADALEAEHQRAEEAEDGLFRVVQTLGFDTDSAANAREFFGPMTYYAGDSEYTKAADIAVAYAAEHRTEMEKESDNLEAERDALRAQIEGHGGWDEWIAEHVRVSEENDTLRAAIRDTPQREYLLPELMEISAHQHAENLRADILSRAIDTKGGE